MRRDPTTRDLLEARLERASREAAMHSRHAARLERELADLRPLLAYATTERGTLRARSEELEDKAAASFRNHVYCARLLDGTEDELFAALARVRQLEAELVECRAHALRDATELGRLIDGIAALADRALAGPPAEEP